MLEGIHGLEVAVPIVVGVDDELRDRKFAEDVAQATAKGNNSLSLGG